jgi:hypothetical protein
MGADIASPHTLHVWALYLRASEEARRRGDRRVGTDHLILALLEEPSIDAILGTTLQRARHALASLDHDALATLDLDVDPHTDVDLNPDPATGPREGERLDAGTEGATGAQSSSTRTLATKPKFRDIARRDRRRLTPAAKAVLEDASRPNRRRLSVTAQQVLLAILELRAPDPAAVLLDALGVDASEVRQQLVDAGES